MQKTTLFSTSRRRSLRPFVHLMKSLKREEQFGENLDACESDGNHEANMKLNSALGSKEEL